MCIITCTKLQATTHGVIARTGWPCPVQADAGEPGMDQPRARASRCCEHVADELPRALRRSPRASLGRGRATEARAGDAEGAPASCGRGREAARRRGGSLAGEGRADAGAAGAPRPSRAGTGASRRDGPKRRRGRGWGCRGRAWRRAHASRTRGRGEGRGRRRRWGLPRDGVERTDATATVSNDENNGERGKECRGGRG
jgi:hypothetical protein